MKIIKNGHVITCDDKNYFTSDILIESGKIRKIGSIDYTLYPEAEIIDAGGKFVSPGLVDPHCHVGIWEVAIRKEGDDINEITDPCTPHLRAFDAVYPHDTAFKGALENGVTAVATGPGSSNIIGGTFCVLKTVGDNVEDMAVKKESAMKMALGENPKFKYGNRDMSPVTRMASAALMRNELKKARNYLDAVNRAKSGKEINPPSYDPKLESLARVFEGLKVKIHAHRSDDIQTAMRIGKEFGLDYTIEHCTEGYLIAEELIKNRVSVILGPLTGASSKYETRNSTYKAAGILEKAGVEFAIMTDHPVLAICNSKIQAALMIRDGLSELTALKALTINAARLNGVDDRIGSLREGKDADIVIWTHNPFDIQCRADKVFIDGNLVHSE